MQRIAIALAAGIAMSIASGCNGSSADADLTKAEFVELASAICKRGSDEIHAGAEAFKKEQDVGAEESLNKAQQEELVRVVVVPAVRAEAKGLAALGVPKGDRPEVAALVKGVHAVARAGAARASSILVPFGPLAAANRAAKSYGVEECMQP